MFNQSLHANCIPESVLELEMGGKFKQPLVMDSRYQSSLLAMVAYSGKELQAAHGGKEKGD